MQETIQEQAITDTTMAYMIITYIQTSLSQHDSAMDLTPDTPLIESGIIDSLTLFKLIDFVQKQFVVKIKPSEITLENFATVWAIEQLLIAKQQER